MGLTGCHLARWRFFYVAGALWAAVVIVLPTVSPSMSRPAALVVPSAPAAPGVGSTTPGADPPVGAPAAAPTLATASGGAAAPGSPSVGGAGVPAHVAGRPGAAAPTATSPAAGSGGGATRPASATTPGAGLTRGAAACRAGVPQLTFTAYSPPCAVATTANGGATSTGVTATTITVAALDYGTDVFGTNIPIDDPVFQTFLGYFNKVYELYGRTVKVVAYQSPHGDELALQNGQGQDAACEDAIALSQQVRAFDVLYSNFLPAEQCLAQHHVEVTDAQGRPPEPFLQQWSPYLLTNEQACDRLADQMAEYARQRLAGRPATYAGDAGYRSTVRKFGVIIPDNATYKDCLSQAVGHFGGPVDTFVASFDYASLPQTMAEAAVRFKADGVTTMLLDDLITSRLLIQSAAGEDWHPEWLATGIGGDDSDYAARNYDASEVDGHLFGRSENAGLVALCGPQSEPERLYKQITGSTFDCLQHNAGGYYRLVDLFDLLQAAGPDLTPQSVQRGAASLPMLSGPVGTWSYDFGPNGQPGQFDAGNVIDAAEEYWDSQAPAFDGKTGDWIVSSPRYRSGQWPSTPPSIHPR